jgi:hypothetical protein
MEPEDRFDKHMNSRGQVVAATGELDDQAASHDPKRS